MKKIVLATLLSLAFFNGNAQKVNQTNAWLGYTGDYKFSEKWSSSGEFQWRRNEAFSKAMQNEYRIGVNYTFNKKFITTLGYCYVQSFAYGEFMNETPAKYNQYAFTESNIWEQIQLKHENIGRFSLDSRIRAEQRWIENKVKNAQGEYVRDNENISGANAEPWKFRQRLRYRLRVQVPLSRTEMKDNTLFFAASDEIFANVGKNIGANVFDQNRLSLAFGWRFNKDFNVQAGYMNQFIEKSDGSHKENNHTIQMTINYNFDFSKSNKK